MFDWLRKIQSYFKYPMTTEEKKIYRITFDETYKAKCVGFLKDKARKDAEAKAKKRFGLE